MSDTPKLLPCPFCGNKAEHRLSHYAISLGEGAFTGTSCICGAVVHWPSTTVYQDKWNSAYAWKLARELAAALGSCEREAMRQWYVEGETVNASHINRRFEAIRDIGKNALAKARQAGVLP